MKATLEYVVGTVKQLIEEKTGLEVRVEKRFESTAYLHLYVRGMWLGYTGVTKTSGKSPHLPKFLIGGTSAGCFMMGSEESSIGQVLGVDFQKLQEELSND